MALNEEALQALLQRLAPKLTWKVWNDSTVGNDYGHMVVLEPRGKRGRQGCVVGHFAATALPREPGPMPTLSLKDQDTLNRLFYEEIVRRLRGEGADILDQGVPSGVTSFIGSTRRQRLFNRVIYRTETVDGLILGEFTGEEQGAIFLSVTAIEEPRETRQFVAE